MVLSSVGATPLIHRGAGYWSMVERGAAVRLPAPPPPGRAVSNREHRREHEWYGDRRGRDTSDHGRGDAFDHLGASAPAEYDRFGLEIHARRLTADHDPVLVKTPNASLSRGIRRIDGRYRQRHDRLKQTGGSL